MEVEFSNKTWVLFLRHYIVLFASWCVFIPDNKLGPPSVLYHVQIVSIFFSQVGKQAEKVSDSLLVQVNVGKFK